VGTKVNRQIERLIARGMENIDNYKVAYLLMVHKQPGLVRRLIERLQFGGCAFWVQVDAKTDINSFIKELADFKNVFFVKNRCNGDWGWFPFVQGNIEGIRAIHESGYSYDHLVILSGQDYLLCSNNDFIKKLSGNRESSFIHYTKINEDNNPHLRERVSKYHIKLPRKKKIVYPYTSASFQKKLINKALSISGVYPLPRVIPGNRDLYFGSNWIRFSKKAVDYTLKVIDNEPDYVEFFKSTLLAEEHFFHTILLNADEADRGPIINTNLTFCHWKRAPELYPVPLGMSDLDLLLSSGDMLARKFDITSDTTILDYLDKKFA
jgi:hypothetical protein